MLLTVNRTPVAHPTLPHCCDVHLSSCMATPTDLECLTLHAARTSKLCHKAILRQNNHRCISVDNQLNC